MKPCNMLRIFIIGAIVALISVQPVFASGIKQRMMERLPVITDLKNKGIVGENNRGYLGYVGASRENEAVVAAENDDRNKVYTHFANQQKTTVDVVESIQGKRKAEKTQPGHFYQTKEGQWVKK